MALMRRLARLFRADFHAVLDRVEEPDTLLRQSLREMEEALAADGHRRTLLEQELERLGERDKELQQTLAGIAEELDLCFGADNEALARPLIRRRIETERLQRRLQLHRDKIAKERDTLTRQLAERHGRLQDLRQKAALYDAVEPPAGGAADWSPGDEPVSEQDVEIALLRERKRRALS